MEELFISAFARAGRRNDCRQGFRRGGGAADEDARDQYVGKICEGGSFRAFVATALWLLPNPLILSSGPSFGG